MVDEMGIDYTEISDRSMGGIVRWLIEPNLGPDDDDPTMSDRGPSFIPQFQNVSGWKTMLSLTLRVLWFTFAILGLSPVSLISLSLTPLSKVSQRPGSSSSHMPPQLARTGPPSSTAPPSLSLRWFSPLVRAYSLSSLPFIDSQLARHDMEDESVPHAALVLYRADCDHWSMFPHSHGCMRMLYLGILSDRL
jgi:hypothetical protein